MPVVAHAGPSSVSHLLVDAAVGIGTGVAVVVLYLLALKYLTESRGRLGG